MRPVQSSTADCLAGMTTTQKVQSLLTTEVKDGRLLFIPITMGTQKQYNRVRTEPRGTPCVATAEYKQLPDLLKCPQQERARVNVPDSHSARMQALVGKTVATAWQHWKRCMRVQVTKMRKKNAVKCTWLQANVPHWSSQCLHQRRTGGSHWTQSTGTNRTLYSQPVPT